MIRALVLLGVLGLGACAAPDTRVPPFARVPYEAFSAQSVVAIALREWRLFGSREDPVAPEGKSERAPGLWQRIGEYWWIGLPPDAPESGWTGKHDAAGRVFPADEDGRFAWSAAFISYVMRIAGAGARFPYAPDHAEYINAARRGGPWVVVAERPDSYAPQPGDLVCRGRGWAAGMAYQDLPTGRFPSHCDIVVGPAADGTIPVVGGNVTDGVTIRRMAVDPAGILDPAGGWLAVLRVGSARVCC